MQVRPRTVSSVAILAMGATLALAPGGLGTANASPVPAAPERTTASAECAAAHAALTAAKASREKAHHHVVGARKALRKAKHAHRPAAVHKAKRVLKRWRHRYGVRSHNVHVQTARVGYACSAPTSAARATGTGMKIDLIALASGLTTGSIDLSQLTALLDRLLPGVSDQLDAGQLSGLLTGFNSGALSLDEATILLGSVFTPEELQQLLAGGASQELVLELIDHVIGQLSGLGGGLPIPGAFDPTDLFETFAGMFGSLDPAQLGGLVDLLLTAAGQGGTSLDLAQLTDLLDALIPGLSSLLDSSELTAMLGAVNAASLDAGTASNLLGGQFSPAEIQQVLDGTASTDLTGEVLAHVLAQLGTIGGGDLVPPGPLDSSALLGLVTSVTDLVSDLLGGVLGGGGGGLVCTLLPLLC